MANKSGGFHDRNSGRTFYTLKLLISMVSINHGQKSFQNPKSLLMMMWRGGRPVDLDRLQTTLNAQAINKLSRHVKSHWCANFGEYMLACTNDGGATWSVVGKTPDPPVIIVRPMKIWYKDTKRDTNLYLDLDVLTKTLAIGYFVQV